MARTNARGRFELSLVGQGAADPVTGGVGGRKRRLCVVAGPRAVWLAGATARALYLLCGSLRRALAGARADDRAVVVRGHFQSLLASGGAGVGFRGRGCKRTVAAARAHRAGRATG